MSAIFTVQVLITRQANPGDAKGSWGPRTYGPPAMQLNVDQELELPLAAGASNISLAIPTLGSGVVPQILLIVSDTPGVTFTRNSEGVAQAIGRQGVRLEAGAPASGVLLTQLVFSNPGSVPATVYVLVGA